jgi:heme A synthase
MADPILFQIRFKQQTHFYEQLFYLSFQVLIGAWAVTPSLVDKNIVDYSKTSAGDAWLLHFTYYHSTHSVAVSLGSSDVLDGNLLGNWLIYVAVAAIVVVIVVAALVVMKRKTKNRK